MKNELGNETLDLFIYENVNNYIKFYILTISLSNLHSAKISIYNFFVIFFISISIFIFLFSFSVIYPPPGRTYTPPGLTTQMPVGQMPVWGATDCEPEH